MTTYYVDVTTGADGDDGLTEGNAFQTLEKAADTVAAGDLVWVKASASYVVEDGANDNVMEISTAGTASAPIVFKGYTSSTGDGGQVTIDASTNTLANAVGSSISGTFYAFWNFRFTGGSSHGFSVNGTSGDSVGFRNCRFDNNGGWGLQGDNGITFIYCTIDNNSSGGVDIDYGNAVLFSKIHTNSGNGLNTTNGFIHSIGNQFYNNGGNSNIRTVVSANAYHVMFLGNSIDGDDAASSIGIHQDGGSQSQMQWSAINNIIMDCATGVSDDANDGVQHITYDYNMMVSNATDYTGLAAGDNDIDTNTDPFEDSANRDYSLATGSAAIDAGTDGGDV